MDAFGYKIAVPDKIPKSKIVGSQLLCNFLSVILPAKKKKRTQRAGMKVNYFASGEHL